MFTLVIASNPATLMCAHFSIHLQDHTNSQTARVGTTLFHNCWSLPSMFLSQDHSSAITPSFPTNSRMFCRQLCLFMPRHCNAVLYNCKQHEASQPQDNVSSVYHKCKKLTLCHRLIIHLRYLLPSAPLHTFANLAFQLQS